MTESVAVIICAHLERRFSNLLQALDSLRHQTRRPDEVVIVVDGSKPLADRIERAVTGMRIVVLPHPSGLAAARNAGVAACGSEIVLFLDDDAVAHADWVERLTGAMDESSVLGASGYSAPMWGAKPPTWLPDEFLWTLGCSYAGLPTKPARVRNVYGGCCGLRRSLFTELGGFDAVFGRSRRSEGGGEEAELCLRAQRRWPGSSFAYEPTARIDHLVWPERLTMKYVLRRSYDEGKMKAGVASLHPGALAPELSFALQLPAAFARHLVAGVSRKRNGMTRAAVLVALSLAVTAGLVVERVRHLVQTTRTDDARARPLQTRGDGVAWLSSLSASGRRPAHRPLDPWEPAAGAEH